MSLTALPKELLEMVAKNIKNDKDLVNFKLACRATHAIVESHYRVWRNLAYSYFDLPAIKTNKEIKQMYQYRKKILTRNVGFSNGFSPRELECVRLIRELIVDSFAGNHGSLVPKTYSNNIATLREFVQRSGLLTNVLRNDAYITAWLKAIQLVLAPWSLEFWRNCPNWSFADSQISVYGAPEEFPLFECHMRDINMHMVLYISNFFKYHLTERVENTLYSDFTSLPRSQRPRMWRSPIYQGAKEIGRFWKGTYAHMEGDMVMELRNTEPGTKIFLDDFHNTDVDFPSLELEFGPTDHVPWWPRDFENKLHGLPTPQLVRTLNELPEGLTWGAPPTNVPTYSMMPSGQSITRPGAQLGVHYLQFTGEGQNELEPSKFQCSGILHPVPPQYGVPGWQRIMFVTCTTKTHTCMHPVADPATLASSTVYSPPPAPIYPRRLKKCCWAFEGVVLPGGTMMYGRYWSPNEAGPGRLNTGPFVYWNVPPKDVVELDDENE